MELNKGGRPPIENAKSRPRQIRFTPEQDAYIQAQADAEGISFAEWVRAKVLPKRLR